MAKKTVQEKIPPTYYSLAAIAAAALIGVGLVWAGAEQPRRYTVSMAINHHSGYGMREVSCQACHVPQGAFSTQLGCMTGACHGELAPDLPVEEAVAKVVQMKINLPNAEELAREYLEMHRPLQGQACWECHTEHTNRPVKWPAGHASGGGAAASLRRPPREAFVSVMRGGQ